MNQVDELVHGTKGSAKILANEIFDKDGKRTWKYGGDKPSMYDEEHRYMFKAIRANEPINNGHYMCNSTLVAILGRLCSYTGEKLDWDKFMTSTEILGPTTYEWGDLPEPPVAIPGKTKFV